MTATTLPPDPTLDEMRAALGAEIPAHAVFDGWGDAALANAAAALGLDPGHARLAFPDGTIGMIEAWYASLDSALAAAFPPERIAAMKIRERIEALTEVLDDLLHQQARVGAAESAVAVDDVMPGARKRVHHRQVRSAADGMHEHQHGV